MYKRQGETLLGDQIVELAYELLKEGHYVNITTNGTITRRLIEFVLFQKGIYLECILPFRFIIPVSYTHLDVYKRQGLGPALAKGVIASSNELIARMDSDDFVVENRVEQQLKIFESDSSLGVVGSFESEFIDNIDNVVSVHRVPEKDDEIKKFMRRRCAVLHPTVIFKKSDVLASGDVYKRQVSCVLAPYTSNRRYVL